MFQKAMKSLVAVVAATTVFSAAYADQPVLEVGATPSAVPFNYLDPQTNTLKGVMIDIANEVGKEVGFKPDIVPIPFTSLVPALQTGKIQIIASAFARTPARAEAVDFTDVVVSYGEGLMVPANDTTPYRSFADLRNKTVGVQIGTAYVDPIKAAGGFKEVKMYDTMADMARDIALGRLDAAFGDGPVVAYQVRQIGTKVRLVSTYKPVIATNIALAVKKGDTAMVAKLNAAIAKLRQDGKLNAILAKWGVAS
ncbi:substrate-binding periplasmic protein [Burkholderia guangdongensis]|uniref:substrate-binding periplasmic protein n=1 Tax=Burkholderia guangdongensis TaxID=1792500 RepID=UPI0015CC7758|nr:ABC transporter substrate-binding protein [Burkholderia guangdongensis]